MKPQSRSLLCKAIICVSICLGAFIAFTLFKATQKKSATNWAQELDSMKQTAQVLSKKFEPSEEEPQKMNAEIAAYRAGLTQEKRDEFDKQVEELEKTMKNMPNEEEPMENIGESPLTWSWGPIEDRGLETWWKGLTQEERKNHKFASDIEQTIQRDNEYLESIKKAEQEEAKEKNKQPKTIKTPLAKKSEQKNQEAKTSVAPKAPEKNSAAVKEQEPKGKKVKPATPSKPSRPATLEKPAIVAPAKAEPVKPATPKEVAKPMVTVKNNIKKSITGYKKFGKNWYPDEYSVTINGIKVEEGEQIAVPAGDGSVCNVVFAYDFRPMGKSYKKGTEEVSYALKPGTKELDITFSWYKTPCIIVNPVMGTGVGNNNPGGRKAQVT